MAKTSTTTKPRGASASTVTELRPRRAAQENCSACGAKPGDHVIGCPNSQCAECKMMAGNHADTCTVLAAIVAKANAPVLNGKTGALIEDTAAAESDEPDDEEEDDGLAEELEDERESGKDEIRRVPPPAITPDLIVDLQLAIENRKLLGIKQPLTRAILCGELHLVKGVEVGCSGYALVAIVDEKICGECEKIKSKRLLVLCIAHGARYAAGEAVDPQMKFQLEYDGAA